jgi:nitrogen-specific signal transduction histidine kinase/CheY-like chemotaxis protein
MTLGNPTPGRLKALALLTAMGDLTPTSAVSDTSSDSELARPDDELVSLQSHQLRTPLTSMLGFAELIDSIDVTDEQRHLYARVMLREGHRLNALINNAVQLQLLETGRRDLTLAPVDIQSLINRAVLAAGEDNQRPIDIHVSEELPLVSADAEAILDVLGNFLSNARRFSPDGGRIRIGARAIGDMVEVSIRDHGIGFEPEALPNLFQKFYRTAGGDRRLGPGAGLGLAMCQGIVEAHGGQVEASSNGPDKGARFQFRLPISQPAIRSGDVLIVDDDPGFARLMKAEFAAQGLSTVRAADAETAEHLLAAMTPRAIVLDLVLPGLQGEEFLARLPAGFGARFPVVVMTAKDLAPAEIAALEIAGAMAVLPKEAGAPQAAMALIAEALALKPAAE